MIDVWDNEIMSFWLSSMSMHSCMLDPSMAIRKGDHFVGAQQKSCNNVLGSIANGWVLDGPTKQSDRFAILNRSMSDTRALEDMRSFEQSFAR